MKKMLIVEDDRLVSAVLTIRLETAGYKVCAAYDAALAMARAVDAIAFFEKSYESEMS